MTSPCKREQLRLWPYLATILLALLLPRGVLAQDYAEGLAPPGVPASAFPAPGRPVAGIVTDTWHDEESRDQAGEAERVMNLLGVKAGLSVADIGAGSATTRCAWPDGSDRPGMSSPRTSCLNISNAWLGG